MLAILDYGVGNLRSLRNALDYVGIEVEVVSDPGRIEEASHVILPGVGAFGKAMANLRVRGFVEPLLAHVDRGKPLLGICLGMQMLATKSFEFGEHEGLGLVPGRVVPFEPTDAHPVPHVGWNNVVFRKQHPLLAMAKKAVDYYFVHSFHFVPDAEENVIATSDYGVSFASIVGRGNVVGCQFHPEKSQAGGLRILEGFAAWDGRDVGA
jgi:glutamine amidotransferase